MAGKSPFPIMNEKQDKAEDAAEGRRMGKGKLPGFNKLPKPKGDNPNDTPAKERAERRAGIKT
jgi:hypothetical protein